MQLSLVYNKDKKVKRNKWGKLPVTETKRRTLYEFDWQLLRTSLSFKDLKEFGESKYKIDNFLAKHSNRARALYKVINLMSAVAMGLSSAACSSKPEQLLKSVQDYRQSLSIAYKIQDKEEDWSTNNETRRAELQWQYSSDIHIVKQSLTLRWIMHTKGPLEYRQTRPELQEYINLLEEELLRRASAPFADQRPNS
jgi:hypothetical protein